MYRYNQIISNHNISPILLTLFFPTEAACATKRIQDVVGRSCQAPSKSNTVPLDRLYSKHVTTPACVPCHCHPAWSSSPPPRLLLPHYEHKFVWSLCGKHPAS
ncbi:hypothetical protein J6590_024011 [Homalodisca vitripennis]|nr:hypothetical protein J6590_024011 [Homalodisca vitripennis]